MKFICLFVTCVSLSIKFSDALYEDQVGKFDWKQQYIGKLKFAHIDSSPGGPQKVIVATAENTLASLNLRTKAIEWRQVLEKGDQGHINALSTDGEVISVSGNGQFLRSWDTHSGVLNWESSLPNLQTLNRDLTRFHVSAGNKEIIAVQIKPKTSVQVTVYRILEANAKTSPQISASWINAKTSCDFASNSYLVCAVQSSQTLQLLYLKNGVSFVAVPLHALGLQSQDSSTEIRVQSLPLQDVSGQPLFGVHLGKDGILIGKVEASGVKLVKVLPKAVDVTASIINEKFLIFALIQEEKVFYTFGQSAKGLSAKFYYYLSFGIVYREYSIMAFDPSDNSEVPELKGTLVLTDDHGKVEKMFILPFAKKDGTHSYKVLISAEDHSLLLYHQQGKPFWTREESLASIISAEMVDLPLSETDVKMEEEFGSSEADVVSMLLTRLSSQLLQLQIFIVNTLKGIQGQTESRMESNMVHRWDMTRDRFGLHKIIVAATAARKVFGVDSLTGQVVWKHFVGEIAPLEQNGKPFFFMFNQRTTAHFPRPAVLTLVGKRKSGPQAYVHSFNPITGNLIDSKAYEYPVIQAMLLGHSDEQYLKGILLLDSQLKVHVYPSECLDVAIKTKDTQYIFVANVTSGTLIGYRFGDDLKVLPVWQNYFPTETQVLTQTVTKRLSEHVHSQGRVMGDRSVLYKYLNPNLIIVVTEGNDPIQKVAALNLYLVDGVTGLIAYSASHKRAKGPVHLVHTENWIVYSYYNEKSRRVEMSSLELYEGMSQSNTTAFSSLSPPRLPIVEHQTFILPAGVDAMMDTITEKGITNKHLLVALPPGGIVELPKAFLDPRRPINPLPEHREEGLIPYIPELHIPAEGIINYNQSVLNVRGIHTAPSGLESTCLVFAYGLDLFYTRVTPSKTFDILKDDFDHFLISAVLIALLILSYVTRKLAARKALRAAWK